MASKYASVIDGLSPAPVADPVYQDKVNAAKLDLALDKETGELTTFTPESLAKRYAVLRAEEDLLEAQRYALQIKLTALEQMIVESWDKDESGWGQYGAGPNTVRLVDGSAVDVEPTPEGKVEDPETFRRWCATPADLCCICQCGADTALHNGEHVFDLEPHAFVPGGGLERKLQLWPSTMNAIAKERTLAGEPPPPGVVVYLRTKVKLRRAK